jgi:hypothetical protein
LARLFIRCATLVELVVRLHLEAERLRRVCEEDFRLFAFVGRLSLKTILSIRSN